MTDRASHLTATARVTYGANRIYDLGSPRDFSRAERDLKRTQARDPAAADRLFVEILEHAKAKPGTPEQVLELRFQPRSDGAVNALLDLVLIVSKTNPAATRAFIPRAYRLGRREIARELWLNLVAVSDDAGVLAQLSGHLLTHETEEDFIVEALSRINSKSPYRVGTLIYQAEFADRRQSRDIVGNVPPITRGILNYLAPSRPITFLDGGATASTMERQFSGWPADRWKVFGFDPHPNADLTLHDAGNVQMIRSALGSAPGKLRLYHTAAEGASSSFKPNLAYIRNLQHGSSAPLDRLMAVVSESDVDVIDLDRWRQDHGAPPFDFIKLNVQGAELDVLRGATETLDACLGVQCEVAFVPIYLGAPLFRDVDQFLDGAGFTFFDLRKPNTSGRMTRRKTPNPGSRAGLFRWPSRQMSEAHVLYLRDPYRPGERDAPRWRMPEAWLRLAVVAEMNGQVGLAMQLCETVLQDFADMLEDRGAALALSLDAAESFYRDFELRNR